MQATSVPVYNKEQYSCFWERTEKRPEPRIKPVWQNPTTLIACTVSFITHLHKHWAVKGLQVLQVYPGWISSLVFWAVTKSTHRILLGCLQMWGFCTSQALKCTSSLSVSSTEPSQWRAQGLGQMLLSTLTSKQGYIHYAFLFFSAREQTNSDDFRVLSPPFLAKSLLFISKPFTFLLSTAWHLCTTPVLTVWCNCIFW